MSDLAKRFEKNPLVCPKDVRPSREGMVVQCVLNPGAFRFEGRIGLLLRVAERPQQEPGWIITPVRDAEAPGGVRILRFRQDDPLLKSTDPRIFQYAGQTYLTTLSHLRLAWSEDGVNFTVEPEPTIEGEGKLETFGVEDCRVTQIDQEYYLTHSAASPVGVGVGMISTRDWKTFTRHGMILPPHNKDGTLFTRRIGQYYYAIHRPSGAGLGGNDMWVSRSPDRLHWGDHHCIATARRGQWDSVRIGAGAEPIETEAGWLVIYHGANEQDRYCLGTMLLDRADPTRVLGRCETPIMEPLADYERKGFFGNVVFCNGQVVGDKEVTLYYGASDEVVCGATFSLRDLLASIRK